MFLSSRIHSLAVRRLLIVPLIVLFVAASAFALFPTSAEAQSPPYIPFGGLSLSVIWCICSFNLWIMVGPPRGGSFIYQPGATILYLFGQIFRPGVWLLGLASPTPIPCVQYVGISCAPIAMGLPMLIVGTSM
ncbi:MAG: hypothetical protein A3C93_04040 [Candidatus Lloydbacteria bacterium RIFCSPHIGHO2_02_FULL_54_17]|uniref:Uncharacterized protein n=1 Tax=Candidatus Lloydbacteria bacterium RIFCSPHIGHO2_02_FULL_54_17 TaxID=1798664 RepID=A0A1G2DHE4_9BACT|nr:MAG: hypothetical protein A2762_03370 [Candidatus Lloydbacteria bacterium RIFCSPHIGHO2_01_FULL_54_11]OGZ12280.1 MAG: hypothetical protein A3C93_04040 [Candidatus Lloydbacteria bacterium RIFCSPHIGHO2_02_FULL_54_17]OGZ13984.1 MAG: hypothetical protein A2948_00690 [Candidatus Lloydbacteria bacterium RIFCSPLOWO2_01_FULL_54_18]OGZ16412.1 MAG: hypothetical protein A3H76_05285 [Candidatus Lloydbacteria bacterium RIFCSPLOWO2_02_FULL_54_12]